MLCFGGSTTFISVGRKSCTIVFSTEVELVLIKERKHGEWSNGHDRRKCENRQNNSREDLHSWGMVAITTKMPRGEEGVYLCLLSLKELKDVDQWAPKEGVWQSYGFQKESSQAKVLPTIKKRSGGCVFWKGWKHSRI